LRVLLLEFLSYFRFDHIDEFAGHVGSQDLWMYVALAADGRRVARFLHDPLPRYQVLAGGATMPMSIVEVPGAEGSET
jgi:hypothetical protein